MKISNLEQAIAAWRQQMLAAGIKTPVPLEELESHLLEEIEEQVQAGASEQQAFEIAVRQIGVAKQIKSEFIKLENWNHALAWIAWGLFVVSFFLPAYADAPGWGCASLSATVVTWPEFWQGKYLSHYMYIHLALLTLANGIMVVSFLWLPFFSNRLSSLKWPRLTLLAAFLLTWSFIFHLVIDEGTKNLEFGCYLWSLSFLLLFLSVFKMPGRKRHATQYV